MAANYYNILNVSKDADDKAISDAYKKMALKWHPDKNPDNIDEANQRFKEISQAYQVLSDSGKRWRYDRSQHSDDDDNYDHEFYDSDDDEGFGAFFQFISPEMLFRNLFQRYESRGYPGFGPHDFDHDRHNSCGYCRYAKPEDGRRNGRAENSRRTEMHRGNLGVENCHIRTVNGKQWMTKTCYEAGNKIVTRYEDGELISKQINGVSQKI